MIVLAVGDQHEPYTDKRYLGFCKKVYKQYKCNKVVMIGDVVDNHALSYHESEPGLMSAYDEWVAAKKMVAKWYKAFPNAKVCIGNHCALPYRKAKTAGIPYEFLHDFKYIWGTPNWDWQTDHLIDEVLYTHGKGSGKSAALDTAILERRSIVMGHLHSQSGVKWTASKKDLLFAVDTGCGIDLKSKAFSYAANNSKRPILSCAVIINGKQPIVIPMPMGKK